MPQPVRLAALLLVLGLAIPSPGHPATARVQSDPSPEDRETIDAAAARDSVGELRLGARTANGRPPRIDGRLDELAWRDAEVATDFVQWEPDPGSPASQATEVRVLHTDDAIFIGARLHDPGPGRIRAPLARRDADVESDWFYVYVDPNRDRSTALAFGVNPRGVKRDLLVTEDGREHPDWQAVWDVAVRRDPNGWSVEMRIPLSQLRSGGASAGGANATWGVNFERRVSRTGEITSWAPIPRDRRRMVGEFGTLDGVADLSPPIRFELLPYSLARVTTPAGGPDGPRRFFGTVGADATLGLGQDFTLSATFNPDFGQVEADPAVVNVSGYRTFFPEKRPFFLEDAELFSHAVGRMQVFHSRRIGRDVQPNARTRSGLQGIPDASGILAASKLSGRASSGWSIGLLHAVTNAETLVLEDSLGVESFEPVAPRTNYVVANVEKESRDGRQAVGGVFTLTQRGLRGDLDDELVSRAVVGGATWRGRSQESRYEARGSLIGSRVEGSPSVIAARQRAHGRYLERPDASHLAFDPAQTSLTGFAADFELGRYGPGDVSWGVGGHALSPSFEANDLGYQREADVVHQFAHLDYTRLGQGRLLRRRRLILTQWSDWTFGRERTATGGRADVQLQFRNLWGTVFQIERHLAALSPDQLRGGPALAMPASTRRRWIVFTDPRRDVQLRLDAGRTREDETGGRFDIYRATLGIQPEGIARLTLEPSIVERDGALEYVTQRSTDAGTHYVFGRASQRMLSLVTRLDLAFSPVLSLQFYAQPYLVSRDVNRFAEVLDPRAGSLDGRFREYGAEDVWTDSEGGRIDVDRTGDGVADFSFPDPAFTYRQLSSNVVLRWEFRPGSTLFAVWSHDFQDRGAPDRLRPVHDLRELVGLGGSRDFPATNVLLVKINYWMSP